MTPFHLHLIGSLVGRSVGPVTERLLDRIPELTRYKSVVMPMMSIKAAHYTSLIPRSWVKCGRHISVECIKLYN